MNAQRSKLASYPCFYEYVPKEIPKQSTPTKRRPGRKPRYPRLPRKNVLDNLEE